MATLLVMSTLLTSLVSLVSLLVSDPLEVPELPLLPLLFPEDPDFPVFFLLLNVLPSILVNPLETPFTNLLAFLLGSVLIIIAYCGAERSEIVRIFNEARAKRASQKNSVE